MPCYRCGARETDPVRGPSSWKRGVTRGAQVLVCPDCQQDDWTAGLDSCPWCGSTMLGRALGETICRACGAVGPGEPAHPAPASPDSPSSPGLAEDVEAALDRLFRRSRARPVPPS